MESKEVTEIIDQLKRDGQWSDAESGIRLIWMNGWIQFSNHQCGMNFSSTETLAKWLLKHSIGGVGQEEIQTPDEGAFMASMDASSRQGFRPDQKKFEIYYSEIQQVSSWDNFHYEVDKNGVTETWTDFFEMDAPPKVQKKIYSFDDYAFGGTNTDVTEYLEAEGLLSRGGHQKRFNFIHNAALFEADQFLKDIYEKLIYRLTKKHLKKSNWNELRECYREGGRFYHNLIHIANVYKALLPMKNEIEDWEVVVLAVLYHDIVYDVTQQDNEEQSATLAKRNFHSMRINSARINRCVNHILATKNHQVSNDQDTNLLIDADLSILGSAPEAYREYAEAIRQEYSIYPDHEFHLGRRAVLEKFLKRDKIYITSRFQSLEAAARANIASEIAEITHRLSFS